MPTEDAHIGTSLPKFSPTKPLLEELLEELENPPVEALLLDELLEKDPEDELLLEVEDEPLLEEELLKLDPPEELVMGLSPSDLQPPRKNVKSTHSMMD